MDKSICNYCGMVNIFVIEYTNPFNGNKSIITKFYCLTKDKGVFFTDNEKLLERYVLNNGKWKRIQKSSKKRKVFDEQLDNDFVKKMEMNWNCPYQIEHQLLEWNKQEDKNK